MTATISESLAGVELTNKGLISDQLWVRLTHRIVKDEQGVDLPTADRIMDQALGFLRLVAEDPKGSHSPSPQVDIGWHTFILYTREYAAFCEEMAGRFIHHAPSDEEGVDYGIGNIARTIAAMKVRGIRVDEPLWSGAEGCRYCNNDCSGEVLCESK